MFKKVIVGFLFFFMTFGVSQQCLAKEQTSNELIQKNGFSVEVIPSATQIDKKFSFFYVHVKPKEIQPLKIKLRSTKKEKVIVNISITNAFTNSYGNIDYGQKNEVDESMKTPLTQMVKPKQKKITLENFEEKIITLNVTPPEKEFQGVRLGAVSLVAENSDEKKKVSNTYGYKIAIMLNETLANYNRGGDLKYKHVGPRLDYGQKVVDFTMQNPYPFVIDQLTVSSTLEKKNNKKIIASNKRKNVSVAPNSTFSFLTYLGPDSLKPGTYKLTVDASNEANQNWHWTKEFVVTNDQARKLNKEATYKLYLPKIYKYLGVLLLILTVVNYFYLFWRRRLK